MTKLKAKAKVPTSSEAIQQIFEEKKALLRGHFLLSSGLHSDLYFQCALVLQYPDVADRFGRFLAQRFSEKIDVVLSPALGGVVLGQAVALDLGVRAIFAERESGKMTLRRGFQISKGEKVLCVEDVLTTGGSVRETVELAKALGGEVVGVGALVERAQLPIDFGVRKETLLSLPLKVYKPEECPLCQQGLPLVKPGSRT